MSKSLPIKDWSPEDRPREKLLVKGRSSLSTAELLALLIQTGTASQNALDLAKGLLSNAGQDVNVLASFSIQDIMKVKGIGQAKAISIMAALELGRRRGPASLNNQKITSSRTVFEIMLPELLDVDHEQFWIILVNRANKIIKKARISQGGVSGTVADPKIIFKMALEQLASGLILVHNHPSGNLTPSQADKELTAKIQQGSHLFDMKVLDHLIIGGQNYFSFADEGML